VLICGSVWWEILSHSNCTAINFHMCISHNMMQHQGACVIDDVYKHGFNGELYDCNCFTLISVMLSFLCAKFIYIFVFTSSCLCVQCCPVEPLTTEHVISMATKSKTDIKYKLLSVQEKLGVMNTVDAT
jgi:hypothetical protein